MANDIIITPGSASIQFSGSAKSSIQLTTDASGSLLFSGATGSLFGITDNLSGSLMSVNTIAGLPALEVFSDNNVNIGKYSGEAIKVTGGGINVALGSGSVMFVTASGRVGIGTNTPGTLLDVITGSSSPAAKFVGYVGIGGTPATTNPGQLDIVGSGVGSATAALRLDTVAADTSSASNGHVFKAWVKVYIAGWGGSLTDGIYYFPIYQ